MPTLFDESQGGPAGPDPVSPGSPLRALLPYTTIALIVVALYVIWVFWSRHEAAQRAGAEAAAKQEQARKDTYDQITQHGELTFVTFEASDGVLHPGQSTQLCYGVVNATSVRLDPPVEQLKPTMRHCIDISPKKTTTYTITAADASGRTKTASLTVKVR